MDSGVSGIEEGDAEAYCLCDEDILINISQNNLVQINLAKLPPALEWLSRTILVISEIFKSNKKKRSINESQESSYAPSYSVSQFDNLLGEPEIGLNGSILTLPCDSQIYHSLLATLASRVHLSDIAALSGQSPTFLRHFLYMALPETIVQQYRIESVKKINHFATISQAILDIRKTFLDLRVPLLKKEEFVTFYHRRMKARFILADDDAPNLAESAIAATFILDSYSIKSCERDIIRLFRQLCLRGYELWESEAAADVAAGLKQSHVVVFLLSFLSAGCVPAMFSHHTSEFSWIKHCPSWQNIARELSSGTWQLTRFEWVLIQNSASGMYTHPRISTLQPHMRYTIQELVSIALRMVATKLKYGSLAHLQAHGPRVDIVENFTQWSTIMSAISIAYNRDILNLQNNESSPWRWAFTPSKPFYQPPRKSNSLPNNSIYLKPNFDKKEHIKRTSLGDVTNNLQIKTISKINSSECDATALNQYDINQISATDVSLFRDILDAITPRNSNASQISVINGSDYLSTFSKKGDDSLTKVDIQKSTPSFLKLTQNLNLMNSKDLLKYHKNNSDPANYRSYFENQVPVMKSNILDSHIDDFSDYSGKQIIINKNNYNNESDIEIDSTHQVGNLIRQQYSKEKSLKNGNQDGLNELFSDGQLSVQLDMKNKTNKIYKAPSRKYTQSAPYESKIFEHNTVNYSINKQKDNIFNNQNLFVSPSYDSGDNKTKNCSNIDQNKLIYCKSLEEKKAEDILDTFNMSNSSHPFVESLQDSSMQLNARENENLSYKLRSTFLEPKIYLSRDLSFHENNEMSNLKLSDKSQLLNNLDVYKSDDTSENSILSSISNKLRKSTYISSNSNISNFTNYNLESVLNSNLKNFNLFSPSSSNLDVYNLDCSSDYRYNSMMFKESYSKKTDNDFVKLNNKKKKDKTQLLKNIKNKLKDNSQNEYDSNGSSELVNIEFLCQSPKSNFSESKNEIENIFDILGSPSKFLNNMTKGTYLSQEELSSLQLGDISDEQSISRVDEKLSDSNNITSSVVSNKSKNISKKNFKKRIINSKKPLNNIKESASNKDKVNGSSSNNIVVLKGVTEEFEKKISKKNKFMKKKKKISIKTNFSSRNLESESDLVHFADCSLVRNKKHKSMISNPKTKKLVLNELNHFVRNGAYLYNRLPTATIRTSISNYETSLDTSINSRDMINYFEKEFYVKATTSSMPKKIDTSLSCSKSLQGILDKYIYNYSNLTKDYRRNRVSNEKNQYIIVKSVSQDMLNQVKSNTLRRLRNYSLKTLYNYQKAHSIRKRSNRTKILEREFIFCNENTETSNKDKYRKKSVDQYLNKVYQKKKFQNKSNQYQRFFNSYNHNVQISKPRNRDLKKYNYQRLDHSCTSQNLNYKPHMFSKSKKNYINPKKKYGYKSDQNHSPTVSYNDDTKFLTAPCKTEITSGRDINNFKYSTSETNKSIWLPRGRSTDYRLESSKSYLDKKHLDMSNTKYNKIKHMEYITTTISNKPDCKKNQQYIDEPLHTSYYKDEKISKVEYYRTTKCKTIERGSSFNDRSNKPYMSYNKYNKFYNDNYKKVFNKDSTFSKLKDFKNSSARFQDNSATKSKINSGRKIYKSEATVKYIINSAKNIELSKYGNISSNENIQNVNSVASQTSEILFIGSSEKESSESDENTKKRRIDTFLKIPYLITSNHISPSTHGVKQPNRSLNSNTGDNSFQRLQSTSISTPYIKTDPIISSVRENNNSPYNKKRDTYLSNSLKTNHQNSPNLEYINMNSSTLPIHDELNNTKSISMKISKNSSEDFIANVKPVDKLGLGSQDDLCPDHKYQKQPIIHTSIPCNEIFTHKENINSTNISKKQLINKNSFDSNIHSPPTLSQSNSKDLEINSSSNKKKIILQKDTMCLALQNSGRKSNTKEILINSESELERDISIQPRSNNLISSNYIYESSDNRLLEKDKDFFLISHHHYMGSNTPRNTAQDKISKSQETSFSIIKDQSPINPISNISLTKDDINANETSSNIWAISATDTNPLDALRASRAKILLGSSPNEKSSQNESQKGIYSQSVNFNDKKNHVSNNIWQRQNFSSEIHMQLSSNIDQDFLPKHSPSELELKNSSIETNNIDFQGSMSSQSEMYDFRTVKSKVSCNNLVYQNENKDIKKKISLAKKNLDKASKFNIPSVELKTLKEEKYSSHSLEIMPFDKKKSTKQNIYDEKSINKLSMNFNCSHSNKSYNDIVQKRQFPIKNYNKNSLQNDQNLTPLKKSSITNKLTKINEYAADSYSENSDEINSQDVSPEISNNQNNQVQYTFINPFLQLNQKPKIPCIHATSPECYILMALIELKINEFSNPIAVLEATALAYQNELFPRKNLFNDKIDVKQYNMKVSCMNSIAHSYYSRQILESRERLNSLPHTSKSKIISPKFLLPPKVADSTNYKIPNMNTKCPYILLREIGIAIGFDSDLPLAHRICNLFIPGFELEFCPNPKWTYSSMQQVRPPFLVAVFSQSVSDMLLIQSCNIAHALSGYASQKSWRNLNNFIQKQPINISHNQLILRNSSVRSNSCFHKKTKLDIGKKNICLNSSYYNNDRSKLTYRDVQQLIAEQYTPCTTVLAVIALTLAQTLNGRGGGLLHYLYNDNLNLYKARWDFDEYALTQVCLFRASKLGSVFQKKSNDHTRKNEVKTTQPVLNLTNENEDSAYAIKSIETNEIQSQIYESLRLLEVASTRAKNGKDSSNITNDSALNISSRGLDIYNNLSQNDSMYSLKCPVEAYNCLIAALGLYLLSPNNNITLGDAAISMIADILEKSDNVKEECENIQDTKHVSCNGLLSNENSIDSSNDFSDISSSSKSSTKFAAFPKFWQNCVVDNETINGHQLEIQDRLKYWGSMDMRIPFPDNTRIILACPTEWDCKQLLNILSRAFSSLYNKGCISTLQSLLSHLIAVPMKTVSNVRDINRFIK